jgi:hypothetical protein
VHYFYTYGYRRTVEHQRFTVQDRKDQKATEKMSGKSVSFTTKAGKVIKFSVGDSRKQKRTEARAAQKAEKDSIKQKKTEEREKRKAQRISKSQKPSETPEQKP